MMSAKWAEKLTRWRPYTIEGRTYDLSHVHPFRYLLRLAETPNHSGREVEIRVGFSAHTFTIGCHAGDVPHEHYSRPNDPRSFCPKRYELSKRLPDLVRSLEKRKCFFTNHKNYFVVDLPEALAAGQVLNTGYSLTCETWASGTRYWCLWKAPMLETLPK